MKNQHFYGELKQCNIADVVFSFSVVVRNEQLNTTDTDIFRFSFIYTLK